MRPETHHRVSLGTLIALICAIVAAAIAWGQVRQQVGDHVDPDRHAAIVVSGQVGTAEKITELATRQAAIVDDVGEVRDDLSAIQADVATIREAAADARVKRAEIQATLDQLLREVQRQDHGRGDP